MTLFCSLGLETCGLGFGLGLAQWSCLNVNEINSNAVTNRSTDGT